ncbi:MAG: cyclic pyranopterin monophosphate synthase [Acidimicrobiales bacterium]|nr:MAG: cyclic pyranopterin monophosphate synthase [Acidimicrobiales bacterium]
MSVTDRCDFRCFYCKPPGSVEWLDRSDLLTFEETARLVRVLVGLGIAEVRLTGGEPTLRRDLPKLVAMVAELGVDVSMTTHGAHLADLAARLAAAGLRRVNVSCDSLKRDRFAQITGRDCLDHVLDGIREAVRVGLHPVKVNAVLVRGWNDDEIEDFVRFARETGVVVRFIEFMPLDAGRRWEPSLVVGREEVLSRIARLAAVVPLASDGGPAERFGFCDGPGEVGVIASVTSPFCASCDRLRLTADGKFRACLFSREETDLLTPLRRGASEDEIAALIRGTVLAKPAGHGIGTPVFVRPDRPMSRIGG